MRSTTLSSAWTMCSIQMMADGPRVDLLQRVDQLEHFGFGEPTGDLVEQQDLGLGREGARQLEPLAVEQA